MADVIDKAIFAPVMWGKAYFRGYAPATKRFPFREYVYVLSALALVRMSTVMWIIPIVEL